MFAPDTFYHIFNRGNNRQKIFFNDANYQFFIQKLRNYISPQCSILAYCLMPNHFHVLLYTRDNELQMIPSGRMQVLERKIGTLQSSYTRAINKQEVKTGSLFQSAAKTLELDSNHAFACFHYIHQKPVKAKLVQSMDEWSYSSYRDYLYPDRKSLCDRSKSYEFLEVPGNPERFVKQSLDVIIDEKTLKQLGMVV